MVRLDEKDVALSGPTPSLGHDNPPTSTLTVPAAVPAPLLGQYWTTDSISEVSYDAAERRISFKMESFCPVSLLQDTYANMPFQGWELRPLEQDSAQLTITGALIEVSIIVKARTHTHAHTHTHTHTYIHKSHTSKGQKSRRSYRCVCVCV